MSGKSGSLNPLGNHRGQKHAFERTVLSYPIFNLGAYFNLACGLPYSEALQPPLFYMTTN
jgi:hypothetical protein